MDNIAIFFLIFGLSGQNPTLDGLMIFSARYLIYLTFILILTFAFRGTIKERKALLLILISLPIVVLIIKLIHIFFFEPRPYVDQNIIPLIPHKEDASFPSRHASVMSAITFAYIFCKSKWVALFLLLLILVGVSRIYIGVHYPLDILGGVIVGALSLLLGLAVKNFFKRFFGFNRTNNL